MFEMNFKIPKILNFIIMVKNYYNLNEETFLTLNLKISAQKISY